MLQFIKQRLLNPRKISEPIRFTPDELFLFLGMKTEEEQFTTWDNDSAYDYAYDAAIREGLSKDDAELAAQDASGNELGDYMTKYLGVAEGLFEELLELHGLTVTKHQTKKDGDVYDVTPNTSWEDAADKIRESINNTGYFHFNNLKEFLRSGPWTPKEAVRDHMEHITSYYEIYEGSNIKSVVSDRVNRIR